MRTRWIVLALVLALLGAGGGYWWYQSHQNAANPTSEQLALTAYTSECYGGSCSGLDPSQNCTDGTTVASKKVSYGFLELRYSPSCKANWGRFTPNGRDTFFWASQKQSIWARVTAWNPGGKSYGTAHHDTGLSGSSWSQMVDGVVTACTGVEVYFVGDHSALDSQGWNWGPCR